VKRRIALCRRLTAVTAVVAGLLAVGRDAAAQRSRPRFEPDDLDLHQGGEAEIDLQVGPMKGDDYVRGFAPDVELSLGIATNAELEVAGTFGIDHDGAATFLDNTLVALRVGIVDAHDTPGSRDAWAGGAQVGTRLPTLRGARGIGVEALTIVGRTQGKVRLFLQSGVLVDCAQRDDAGARTSRPTAVELGVDLDIDLDARDVWSLKGELGGARFFSPDDPQLHLVAGPAVKVTKGLELSAVALVGLLEGSDRLGILLGASTRFKTF